MLRQLRNLALPVIAAVALFHLGIANVLFLLPLQWLWVRQGAQAFWLASALAWAGVLAVKALVVAFGFGGGAWVLLDLALPLAVWIGLAGVNAVPGGPGRRLNRVLAAAAVFVGVVTVIWGFWLSGPSWRETGAAFFAEWWDAAVLRTGTADSLLQTLDREGAWEFVSELVPLTLGFTYFLILAGLVRLGQRFGAGEIWQAGRFRVPEYLLWVLLPSWLVLGLLALADRQGWNLPLRLIEPAVSSAAWISLTLYALQGWGIIRWRMERFAVHPLLIALVRTALVVGVLMPYSQTVVCFGLPLVGVLETWIRFRKEQGESV